MISEQIIAGCLRNDPKSQRQLYDLTLRQIYNVVYRMVLDKHHTEDVLQVVYLNIFRKIEAFDHKKGTILAWMNKVAINCSINYLKSVKFLFEDIEEFESMELCNCSVDETDALYIFELLHRLPEQQRIIFNLYEIEGYSHEEIAALLKINVNSCRVYLSRAKSKLQIMVRDVVLIK